MGVYLSTPNTELESEDGRSSRLVFGAASMQGWRTGQEDAHIAIVDYDTDTSLFGVFDGHGGQEVAKYCAQRLPTFIKSLNSYQNHKFNDCLEEAFLEFDKTLIQQEVINDLKILSGSQDLEEENSEDDINEAILLREEADLPMNELMARYNNAGPQEAGDEECSSSSGPKPQLSLPSHMKSEMSSKSKPISPFLRAKRTVIDGNHQKAESVEECSSSSASTTCPSVTNTDSHSTSQPDSTDGNEVDLKSNEQTVSESDESNSLNGKKTSNGKVLSTNNGSDCEPTSSIGDVVSDEDKHNNSGDIPKTCETDNNCETIRSEEPITSLPYKGKGKHKKIVTPIKDESSVKPDSSEESDQPIYEYFLQDMDGSDDDEDSEDGDDFRGKDESSDDEEEEEEDDETSESESESEEEDVEGVEPMMPSYEKPGYDSGCTAVVALLRGSQLFVANAGDSRCVVSRNGRAIEMSIDHKPEDELERNRVEKAGGKVTQDGRVNGGLNLSRAIGDHSYKNNKNVSDREQMITALPDVKTLDLEQSDDFMVIACDGIWNSMTSQQVVDFVGHRINKTDKLSSVCDELFRTCLAPNTHGDGTGCDNMTAVIVKFLTTSSKRKLDDIEDANHSESEAICVSTEEPDNKKTKTNDCVSDDSNADQKIVDGNDGSD
ncbi:unnamed protein product [Oppiella nova]|uniref:protein-serine/threonine phosphatase n=1 Tax=Oppiella nova TaxID=334625 RepID=A0A7R9LBZ6_9ACAR|nr:unnamed protein product [Oppiella nova]CAG2160671.1 unnamed protein product [Oppiella nova]